MTDYDFRRPFPFINSTIYTEHKVPLPVNDIEKVYYYNDTTKFSLTLGNGAPAYTPRYNSYKGFLCLTNIRIIYIPENDRTGTGKHFKSFFIPPSDVLGIENDSYFEIKVNESYLSNIYINCEEAQLNVFFASLRRAVANFVKNTQLDAIFGEGDVLPLYCEIAKLQDFHDEE